MRSKISKKIVLFLSVLLLLGVCSLSVFMSPAPPEDCYLSYTAEVSPSVVYAGETFEVKVSFPVNQGFLWAQAEVSYDTEQIEYLDHDPSDSAFKGANEDQLLVTNPEAGNLKITVGTMAAIFGAGEQFTQTGTVTVLRFRAAEGFEGTITIGVLVKPANVLDLDKKLADQVGHVIEGGGCTFNIVDRATHKHTEEIIPGKEPTCTEPGMSPGKKCSFCQEMIEEPHELEATGHADWTRFDSTHDGKHTRYCSNENCPGEIVDCQFGEWVENVDDCEKGGTKTRTCDLCGYEETETVAPKAHNWDNGNVTKEATCTEAGKKEYHCLDCGKTRTDEIEATGHGEWTKYTSTKDGKHKRTCDHEDCPGEIVDCQFGEWVEDVDDCEKGGTKTRTCDLCGYEETETVAPKSHNWDNGNVTKPATCTEAGEKEYHCLDCGKTKTEEIAKLAHSEQTVPGKAATCTEAGLTDGTKCAVCGETLKAQETIPAKGHTVVEDEAVEPTYSETGLTRGSHCSVCGEVIEAQEVIPEKSLAPIIVPIVVVVVLAAGGVAAFIIIRKRRNASAE